MKKLLVLLVLAALSLSSAQEVKAQRGTDIKAVRAQLNELLISEGINYFSDSGVDSMLVVYYGEEYSVRILDFKNNLLMRAEIEFVPTGDLGFIGLSKFYHAEDKNFFATFLFETKKLKSEVSFHAEYESKLFCLHEQKISNQKWTTFPIKTQRLNIEGEDTKVRKMEIVNRREKISVAMYLESYPPWRKTLLVQVNGMTITDRRQRNEIIDRMIVDLETLPPTTLFVAQEATKSAEADLENGKKDVEFLEELLKEAKVVEKEAEKVEKETLKEEERAAKEAIDLAKGEDARRMELEKMKRESDEQIKKNADQKAANKEEK